jgi:hypothetical protein
MTNYSCRIKYTDILINADRDSGPDDMPLFSVRVFDIHINDQCGLGILPMETHLCETQAEQTKKFELMVKKYTPTRNKESVFGKTIKLLRDAGWNATTVFDKTDRVVLVKCYGTFYGQPVTKRISLNNIHASEDSIPGMVLKYFNDNYSKKGQLKRVIMTTLQKAKSLNTSTT